MAKAKHVFADLYCPLAESNETCDLSRVPNGLLLCDRLHEGPPRILGTFDGWAVALQCKTCAHQWYVCSLCHSTRKRIYSKLQLKNHTQNEKHKRHAGKHIEKRPKTYSADPLQQDQEISKNQEQEVDEEADSLVFDDVADISEAPLDLPEELTKRCPISHALGTSLISLLDIKQAEKLSFSDQISEKFFQNARLRRPGESGNAAGMAYLLLLSHFQRELSPEDLFQERKYLNYADLLLEMQIAEMFLNMPRTRVLDFVSVLHGSHALGCEDGYHNAIRVTSSAFYDGYSAPQFAHELMAEQARKYRTLIPSTVAEANKYYIQNKFSILKNLPKPKVKDDIHGHAYVGIIDCIRDALAYPNARIDSISGGSADEIRWLSESNKAKDIFKRHRLAGLRERLKMLGHDDTDQIDNGMVEARSLEHNIRTEEEVLSSYYMLWNDDIDVNSAAMQGRANVWIKSMTIAQPPDDTNRVANTYPIACGGKGVSHNAVERKINDEVEMLEKGLTFFVGALNKKVKIRFSLMANLADQPERRSANYLLGTNSIYHSRTAVSANHFHMYNQGVLRACACCEAKMTEHLQQNTSNDVLSCKQCLSWDALKTGCDLALTPLPEGYPNPTKHKLPNNGRVVKKDGIHYLRPSRITYNTLKQAVITAHTGFVHNGWSMGNCRTFLTTEGINDNFIQLFQSHANRAKALSTATGEILQELQEDRESNPQLYEQAPFPANWVRLYQDLCDTVDAPMHLLFLGLVDSTMELIQMVLTSNEQNNQFIAVCAKYLNAILDMSLDWIKLRPYVGGKFYGWNSENYQGFARIMLWFYQNISRFPPKDQHKDAPPPDLPQTKWKVAHFRYWLKIRRLESEGRREVLVERVANYQKQETVPEPMPLVVIETAEIELLVTRLLDMLERIMSATVDKSASIRSTKYAICLFINAYDDVEAKIIKPKKKPSCISKPNFLCLLNIPEAMERYGPVRSLWEGKIQGEGFLRFVKPEMTQGLRTNWSFNLISNCLLTKSFRNITDDNEQWEHAETSSPDFLRLSRGMFHKYQSALQVNHAIFSVRSENKEPISVILVQPHSTNQDSIKIFAVVHDYTTLLEIEGPVLQQAQARAEGRFKFGLTYYALSVANNGKLLDWEREVVPSFGDKTPKIGYALLLPLLENNATEDNRLFAIVACNWKVLSANTPIHKLL